VRLNPEKHVKNNSNDYVIRVLDSPLQVPAADWNALLAAQPGDGSLNPFMRHEYLAACWKAAAPPRKPAGRRVL